MLAAKAFRLFISSTFKDFSAERELLQGRVFPDLERHCATKGYRFQAVDMRWGINADAQLDQRTAEICLDEVRDAKEYPAPNLLVLIGDRYGWVALPFAIAQDEFEAARDWLQSQGRHEFEELTRVYQRDDNHLITPGLRGRSGLETITAYTLRSREDDIADLRDARAWETVETRLREALQQAAEHLHGVGRLDESGRDKYFLSVTEQEIRWGLDGLKTNTSESPDQTIAWIRTTDAADRQVSALTMAVQRALPERNIEVANLQLDDKGYADVFVATITAKLKSAIDQHIATVETQTQAPDSALRSERAIHQGFAADRRRVFVGRGSNRAAIAKYIRGEARHPLVLSGISGSGKTALLACAAADADEFPSVRVVKRFVGASAASADQRALLVSLVEDLAGLGVAQVPEQWEDDPNRFVAQVRDLIAKIDQQVVIFVDALDQIRQPYRSAWLPAELHGRVKLIVSVLDDEAFPQEQEIVLGLRRSLPPEAIVAIEPLTTADGRDILAGLERGAHRGLQPLQRDFIIERFVAAGASPLYLRIAFAVARCWRSTDDPRTRGLADDVTSLIGQFIDELASVHHHEPHLVRRALGFLAAGKDGLSESELTAVLSRDNAVMEAISSERFGAHAPRLPDSVWVRFRRSLSALLVEKEIDGEPILNFFHRQVAEVVRAHIYEPERTSLHQALATFFDTPVKVEDEAPLFSRRSLSELPYQLFHAPNRARLDVLLTDPAWIYQKITAFGGVAEIVEDYENLGDLTNPIHPLIGRTLRLASGLIKRDPRQGIVQLHGRLLGASSERAVAAFTNALYDQIPDCSLIETRPALAPPGRELARLEGHGGPVNALMVLPDRRLASGSGDATIRLWDAVSGRELARLEGHGGWVRALAMLPDGRLASGSSDGTIRLWDAASGRELARLEGHGGGDIGGIVRALVVLPDGRLASGTTDGTIRLWDAASGRELARLEGGSVNALTALPDGRLASGSDDGTIRLWDVGSGRELARLEGHGDWVGALAPQPDGLGGTVGGGPGGHGVFVNALAVLPDGRLASGSSDGTIRLWDAASGRELARLEGHDGPVWALAALTDGRLASGGSLDGVRLWETASGRQLARLVGHGGKVSALAVLPEGRLASGSSDNTIRLWETIGDEMARLEGHADWVSSLEALPDGRVASGSNDGTIRLWDAASGREAARLEGHGGWLSALTAVPKGRLASGSADGTIRLWDATGGRELDRLEGHGGWVRALAVLPDGRLASGSDDRTIRLWDASSGRELARLEGQRGPIRALAVLSDGRLASSGSDGTIWLWDATGGRELARLESDGGLLTVPEALAALPDGRLASGSDDGIIRLWDVGSGRELARLKGHGGQINALAALPDGRLVSVSDDRTIRLWDAAVGRGLARLEIDGCVTALTVLPDGRLTAGDRLGRLHWLAIKEFAVASLARSAARSPPAVAALPAGVPVPSRPAQPGTRSPPTRRIGADDKRPARAWAPLIITLVALLAAAFAAALWGPYFGIPAAHDVLARLLAMLSKR